MEKSIHSPEYNCVCRKLTEMREEAGLTQKQLADMLNREQSFIWRIEHGERRLDLVEFFWVCRALGYNARDVYRGLVDDFCRYTISEKESEIPMAAEKGNPYRTKAAFSQNKSDINE